MSSLCFLRRDRVISQRASTDLKEHGQGGDPPSFPDGGIQTSGVVWIVTEDLHLNIGGGEKQREVQLRRWWTNARWINVPVGRRPTSRGYFIPFRLCSDPSDVALQCPQWKVMVPTRNLELSPPPLTKKSPSTRRATRTHTWQRQQERQTTFFTDVCRRESSPTAGWRAFLRNSWNSLWIYRWKKYFSLKWTIETHHANVAMEMSPR